MSNLWGGGGGGGGVEETSFSLSHPTPRADTIVNSTLVSLPNISCKTE